MKTIRIGPDNNVPRIRKRIESTCFRLFFARYVKPTTTGRSVRIKKKSYLSRGPNVARPMKNFEESIFNTPGYIVSPENMIEIDIPITIMYDDNIPNFFFVEISVLDAKNNVIIKYGATNAFVKKERM